MKSSLDRFMPGHTNLVESKEFSWVPGLIEDLIESNEFSWVPGLIEDLANSTQHTCLTNRDRLASNTNIV